MNRKLDAKIIPHGFRTVIYSKVACPGYPDCVRRYARGLRRLAERCGEDFVRGVLFYAGEDIFNFKDKRLLAVPLKELWER